jgi:uncharacterized iron-regulated membrane protein
MKLRKVIFWLHLLTGTMAGSVILVMAVSGALLALEPQIVEWSERDLRAVPAPAADAKQVDLDTIVAERAARAPRAGPPW